MNLLPSIIITMQNEMLVFFLCGTEIKKTSNGMPNIPALNNKVAKKVYLHEHHNGMVGLRTEGNTPIWRNCKSFD